MKECVLIFFLASVVVSGYAQSYTFNKKWDRRFGGISYEYSYGGMRAVEDGGIVIAGTSGSGLTGDKTQPNYGSTDFWIIKVDSTGNKVWDKRYGSTGPEGATCMLHTADSGYVFGSWVGGSINNDVSEPSRGNADYWIIKVNSAGVKQWDKRFGGSNEDLLWALKQTKDGGYILGGGSVSGKSGDKTQENWDSTHFYSDYWVVKTDSVGNKQWDKRFGGIQDENLTTIEQTNDGGYILNGISKSDISGDRTVNNLDTQYYLNASADHWIVKIDSLGNKKWDKRFGQAGYGSIDGTIATNDNGCILVLGSFGAPDGVGGAPWIIKLDEFGNKQWERGYSAAAAFKSIVKTNDGGYLICGNAVRSDLVLGPIPDRTEDCLGRHNTWVLKTDSLGYKQWDKMIFTTGNDYDGYAVQTEDGCYAISASSDAGIGGYKTQAAWDSSYDFFIVKFCMDTFTAINELTQQTQIAVYPNPFTTDLSISLQTVNTHQATFAITDITGKTIYRREETNLAPNYTKMLDLSYLPNGVYFVTVLANGETTTRKIVKQ